MRRREPTGHGFTLIELMIVVAIIAILAAILIPNFMHARAQANTTGCEGNVKMIATGLEEYAVDHDGLYVSGVVTSALLGTPYLAVSPKDPVNGSSYAISTTVATAGSYQITDSGGHDLSTTLSIGGGTSVIYNQNSGITTLP